MPYADVPGLVPPTVHGHRGRLAVGHWGDTPALLFHGSFGFRELGQNTMPQVDVRASMLAKELCSYPWVKETYGGKLPDGAWTRARQLPAQAQRPTGTGAWR